MSQALGPAQRDPLNPSGVQSDLPVVNEGEAGFTGLSPRDSLRYESMTPQEVVRDNLGRGLFGPIPNYVKDGDDVFDDGMKNMLSPGIPQNISEMDANTLTYWSGKLSKGIGMYHDAMNNINGQDQTGTVDDALMTLRTRYQALMAPLEAKRAQILAEMFGPENAKTIVSLKELNPVQASLALGAATASLVRGEDPTNAINMLAAPVREVLARKAKEQEMMKARLGVEYEATGDEMKFERQRYAAEEQGQMAADRAQAAQDAAAERQDKQIEAANQKRAEDAYFSISESKLPDLKYEQWLEIYAKDASPTLLARVKAEAEARGKEREVKTALAQIKTDKVAKEKALLDATFEDVKKTTHYKALKAVSDAGFADTRAKSALEMFKHLPQKLRDEAVARTLDNDQTREAITKLKEDISQMKGVDLKLKDAKLKQIGELTQAQKQALSKEFSYNAEIIVSYSKAIAEAKAERKEAKAGPGVVNELWTEDQAIWLEDLESGLSSLRNRQLEIGGPPDPNP